MEERIVFIDDLEKVTLGLKCCKSLNDIKCRQCPYLPECDKGNKMDSILSDALSLIQKQQAVIDDLLQKNKKEASYEQVIYTCPKCGGNLLDITIATYPPILSKHCMNCGWSWEEKSNSIIRIPFTLSQEESNE